MEVVAAPTDPATRPGPGSRSPSNQANSSYAIAVGVVTGYSHPRTPSTTTSRAAAGSRSAAVAASLRARVDPSMKASGSVPPDGSVPRSSRARSARSGWSAERRSAALLDRGRVADRHEPVLPAGAQHVAYGTVLVEEDRQPGAAPLRARPDGVQHARDAGGRRSVVGADELPAVRGLRDKGGRPIGSSGFERMSGHVSRQAQGLPRPPRGSPPRGGGPPRATVRNRARIVASSTRTARGAAAPGAGARPGGAILVAP